MESCQLHLAAGQVNRNKHLVKTLLHLGYIYFDGLALMVMFAMMCSLSLGHRQEHHALKVH